MRSRNYSVKQQNLYFLPILILHTPLYSRNSLQNKMKMPRKAINSNLWSRQHWPALWAQGHRTAWAGARRGPLRTPGETEWGSEQTWFKCKHFVSSALMFCKKHTRCSKYRKKNFLWLEFQSWKSIMSFNKMQHCYTVTTSTGTPGFPFRRSLLFYSIQSQLHLKN